jgi:DNA-binding transcriptional ArsR family regulator
MDTVKIAHALSTKVRVQILRSINNPRGPASFPREISEDIGVDEHLVAHHLKILEELGLVVSNKVGQRVYYGIVPEILELTIRELIEGDGK